jgi:hypothetical protein
MLVTATGLHRATPRREVFGVLVGDAAKVAEALIELGLPRWAWT